MVKSLVSTVSKNNKKEISEALGSVTETLPNTLFKVQVDEGNQVLAYLSGRMRMNRIKVLVGDRVSLVLDPHGGRARITKRI